jgi:hypothetical protein
MVPLDSTLQFKSPLHKMTLTTPTCLWNDSASIEELTWSIENGDVVISPPCVWQRRYNSSDIEVISRINDPIAPRIVDCLLDKFPDFARAYNENGLTPAEFDTFGPTAAPSASSSPPAPR